MVAAGDDEAAWLLETYKRDVQEALRGNDIPDTQIYFDLKQKEMEGVAALASPDTRGNLADEIRGFIADEQARVEGGSAIVPAGTEQQVRESKRLFPKALLGGPAVDRCFTEEQLQDIGRPKWSSEQLVCKSWADGTRSIYDITRLAILETGAQLDLAYALTLFRHYAQQGIVSLA
jgi:hypothetical protein